MNCLISSCICLISNHKSSEILEQPFNRSSSGNKIPNIKIELNLFMKGLYDVAGCIFRILHTIILRPFPELCFLDAQTL